MARQQWRSAQPRDRSARLDRVDPVQRDAELSDAGSGEYADLSQPARRPRSAASDHGRAVPAECAGRESSGHRAVIHHDGTRAVAETGHYELKFSGTSKAIRARGVALARFGIRSSPPKSVPASAWLRQRRAAPPD